MAVVGALEGIRVIDMSSVVMGPSATQFLGDLGADVIKVESPEGDTTRQVTPRRNSGMGYAYLQKNRNKRSIVLDVKQPLHHDALERLIASSDIFVTSIRPAALQRLGLGPSDLAAINPALISLSLVGYGAGGPYSGAPAYEDLIQGLTAVPSLLQQAGAPEPLYVPVAFNDRAVGLYAVGCALAALHHRDRTGEGQHIEVPMFETMAQFVVGDHMGGHGWEPPIAPPGYARTLTPERRPYRTKDGHICVIVYTDRHWRAFGEVIGRPNLMDEHDFLRDLGTRTTNAGPAYALVRETMLQRTTEEWLEVLRKADIPATPVHTLESIFDDPHLKETGFFTTFEHPTEGPLRMIRGPVNWSKTPPTIRQHAPRLGEHSENVLQELGFTSEEIGLILDSDNDADGTK